MITIDKTLPGQFDEITQSATTIDNSLTKSRLGIWLRQSKVLPFPADKQDSTSKNQT